MKIWQTNQIVSAKPESVLEIKMHKTLWDFENSTDCAVPWKRKDLIINNKTKTYIVNFGFLLEWNSQKKKIDI